MRYLGTCSIIPQHVVCIFHIDLDGKFCYGRSRTFQKIAMNTAPVLECINQEFERLTEAELTNLGVVLGAYRSFRGDRRSHIAYVGMPITTGKRLVDVLSEHGVKTREELAERLGPKALWELVIRPNIEEGIAFADTLGQRHNLLFIAPSVFEAKQWRWSQDAYMSLWYRVIGELAGKHYVMNGWQYSVGGVKEVLFSMFMQWGVIRPFTAKAAHEAFGLLNFHPGLSREQLRAEYEGMLKIRVYDHEDRDIDLPRAMEMVSDAILDLAARGFSFEDLRVPATQFIKLWAFSPVYMAPRNHWPYEMDNERYLSATQRLKAFLAQN